MKRSVRELMFFLALLVFAGCIKEDRSGCPCRLVLDFSDVDAAVVKQADVLVMSDDGYRFAEMIESSRFADYTLSVPRTHVTVCAWAGAGYCLNEDMSVAIPYGEECPRVFLHVSDVNADSELVQEKMVMRKNHCVMTVQVEKGEGYPYQLTVKGKVDGYDEELAPAVGEFSCRAVPDTSGRCVVVLPRQLDSSLTLEVDDGTEALKIFAIGETIVAGGYDWKASDLDDVSVTLDYSLTEVALDIVEWENESVYDVII